MYQLLFVEQGIIIIYLDMESISLFKKKFQTKYKYSYCINIYNLKLYNRIPTPNKFHLNNIQI